MVTFEGEGVCDGGGLDDDESGDVGGHGGLGLVTHVALAPLHQGNELLVAHHLLAHRVVVLRAPTETHQVARS